ncbi:hypothetical protein C804_06026 [Lachnospiraceae bacterium A4]|nr:hypothetical protein C804_06026 [Lachnospiraceae bacterium A4]
MTDAGNAIEVRNVTKKFRIYHDKGKMLKERAISRKRNLYDEHHVLNDISFNVKKGEAVGLIGQNGCGKSTTLKLLTRIMYPDSGTIEISGRVSSLLELGAGFHPDLSGRENIYINASIFGLTRHEIDSRLGEIIAFSELEEFIDNPVRTYSSGMYMRLAFAVAINVNADILLIDEILAVGDVNFQAKCFNKLMEIKNNGTTVVLVSHSASQVESVCDRAIWIHEGNIRGDGKPYEINQEYLMFMDKKRKTLTKEIPNQKYNSENTDNDVTDKKRFGTGETLFESCIVCNRDGEPKKYFGQGDIITFKMNYKVIFPIDECYFGLSIFRSDGIRCYGTNTYVDGKNYYTLVENGSIEITFDDVQLLKGQYYVDICISKKGDIFVDYWAGICKFEVFSSQNDIGIMAIKHKWGN